MTSHRRASLRMFLQCICVVHLLPGVLTSSSVCTDAFSGACEDDSAYPVELLQTNFHSMRQTSAASGREAASKTQVRDRVYNLVLFPEDSDARCLDGSPGGYYWSKGVGENASRWILFFEGGGWCVPGDANCQGWAGSMYRSSTEWEPLMTEALAKMKAGSVGGILSGDPSINPHFHSWSIVHVNYCDGGSYAGNRDGPPDTSSGKPLYFRGKRILDATIESLLEDGLATATNAILCGSSAGGLATYIHADYIRQQLPRSVDFVALADAGMFVDLPELTGAPGYMGPSRKMADMQNVSALNDQCVQHYGDEHWRCFMAPYATPFIETPLFMVQALYDTWQVRNLIGLKCTPPHCEGDEDEALSNLGAQIQLALHRAPPGSGIFATPCFYHEGIYQDQYWNNLMVNGSSMSDAFAEWWRTRTDMKLIDTGDFGSNSCAA